MPPWDKWVFIRDDASESCSVKCHDTQIARDTEIIIAVAIIANQLIFKIIIWDINDVEHCNN